MKKLLIPIPKIYRPKRRMPAPGAKPGTLETRTELPPPTISRVEYNEKEMQVETVDVSELETALQPKADHVVWVDIAGLGDAQALQRVAGVLNLHPLTLEDIAHTHQRPKIEELDGYLFTTIRAIRVHESANVDNEQISMLLFDNLLVTFQERPGDGFEPVRRRLRENKGPMRKKGADYLFYALLDVTIDNYFPVLELYGESMDQLDEEIRTNPTGGLSRLVHNLRRELRQLRRATWPLRDVAGTLGRNEVRRIDPSLQPAFRDCYDHAVVLADFVESSRERASDLGDLHQTMVGERTNQVMKTLTIVATIFIPLTFLCGLYGMNFDPEVSPYNMPELKWRYGYVGLLAVMLTVFGGMMWLFKRRGWIGAEHADERSSRLGG